MGEFKQAFQKSSLLKKVNFWSGKILSVLVMRTFKSDSKLSCLKTDLYQFQKFPSLQEKKFYYSFFSEYFNAYPTDAVGIAWNILLKINIIPAFSPSAL